MVLSFAALRRSNVLSFVFGRAFLRFFFEILALCFFGRPSGVITGFAASGTSREG